jgi:Fe-S cluster assembly protein SufD
VTSIYLDQFAALRDQLPGGLDALRQAAIERFAASGFPSQKTERWRYTALAPIARAGFRPAEPEAAAVDTPLPEAPRAVFVNGFFRADLSDLSGLGDGVGVTSLATAWEAADAPLRRAIAGEDGPAALNGALMRDGALIRLEPGAVQERPVHLVYLGAKADVAQHLRNVIIAGEDSRLVLAESYFGPDETAYWTNVVSNITLGARAVVRHVKHQAEGRAAFHIALAEVRLAAGALYDNFALALGGATARNEINAVFGGEDGECRLNGVYLASDTQKLDATTVIDHASAKCSSRQLYKGVLGGAAQAAFQGGVIVRPDAQETDAIQANHNLLLSRGAEVASKPELEIHADNVKCAHGSTVGELDETMLFYLQARGLEKNVARGLLIEGFVAEVFEEIADEALRDSLKAAALARLLHLSRGEKA